MAASRVMVEAMATACQAMRQAKLCDLGTAPAAAKAGVGGYHVYIYILYVCIICMYYMYMIN